MYLSDKVQAQGSAILLSTARSTDRFIVYVVARESQAADTLQAPCSV